MEGQLAYAGSGRRVALGAGPTPEEVPASQLPACFVAYLGTDEFPAAGDDELFASVRFRLTLIVKGPDDAERIESAVKLVNDVKDTLMVDRFRSSQSAYGPAQKPTELMLVVVMTLPPLRSVVPMAGRVSLPRARSFLPETRVARW